VSDPSSGIIRCRWADQADGLMKTYHDEEWGVPVWDDKKLFEFMVLDAFQAGLSWLTILKRRDHFRNAFDGFDPERIARYDEIKTHELLNNPGIIRNRQKISSTVSNARGFLLVTEEFGSFSRYIWGFTGGRPKINVWKTEKEIPAETAESRAMSRDLVGRGFRFVGPTICYAFMQAAGLVNDHTMDCFRHDSCL
jgi:DNA-3-methyladenine glycosylase I